MRIEDVSHRLLPNGHGIYVGHGSGEVSYSETGHADCFLVEDQSFWFRHRNNCIAALIARYPYRGTLLDVGGGNGYVSQRLIAQGGDVMLLEPGMAGALNARYQRGIENVVCSRLEDAAFEHGAFGAIGLFDVIEHIEDDRGFLRQVAPLLIDGGMLYMTVPCHAWLWSTADVAAGHFRRHTITTLQALLGEHFAIDYISYFFQPLILPQWLLRALPYRLGLSRKTMLSSEAEHGTGSGLLVRALERMLKSEPRKVANGERIRFGASCLVAAHRANSTASSR